MIGDFFSSWSLFWQTYLTSIFASVALSFVGVFAVTRGQVFVAAAISQASLLGIAVALKFGWELFGLSSVVFCVLASLFISGKPSDQGHISEEKTGLVFLFSASLAIILLMGLPNGMRQLQSISSSTVLGAGIVDLILFGALALISAIVYFTKKNQMVLFISDPVMAASVGLNISLMALVIGVSTGLVAGLGIQTAGMLFAFGVMVLPAFTARNICRSLGTMFVLAPMISVLGTLVGLFISVAADLPPGQASVFTHSVLLLCSWIWKEFRHWIQP